MLIELDTDSKVWMEVKHALREAGYKVMLQSHTFDDRMSLFLEPRREPEGGELRKGLLVYEGGRSLLFQCLSSEIEDVRQTEINRA